MHNKNRMGFLRVCSCEYVHVWPGTRVYLYVEPQVIVACHSSDAIHLVCGDRVRNLLVRRGWMTG